ncbi:MAG: hypothetical protein DRG39_03700 [Deltaproteobacteria bacterium]|nr:MAG: hypothetical protein DRG39_03700 [Deltaproteobacteria bacterium]
MYIGCDIGTGYTKGILMDNEGVIKASCIIPTVANPRDASKTIIKELLNGAGLKESEIKGCGSTGWGRSYVPMQHRELSLINSIAKGVSFVHSSCRTVIDVGAQHSMVILVDEKGQVLEFRQNDRCAAGSGRFIEVISEALRVPLEEVSSLVLNAKERVNVTAQCAVFAESEVIAHVNDGKPVDAILAGIIDALGRSLVAIAKRLSVVEDIFVSGGMAKNAALIKVMQEHLQKSLHVAEPDPRLVGAIGAALLVKEVI